MKIKLRSFKSSENINEKWGGLNKKKEKKTQKTKQKKKKKKKKNIKITRKHSTVILSTV